MSSGRPRRCSPRTSPRVSWCTDIAPPRAWAELTCGKQPLAECGHDFGREELQDLAHLFDRDVPGAAEVAHEVGVAHGLDHLDLADDPLGISDDLQLFPAEVGVDLSALEVLVLPELEALGDLAGLGVDRRARRVEDARAVEV